ncbi:hypothetical protein VTJ04DRAFT_2837 [Mycothermus thermophilus]|uniref:uncharacterized protein n=1 Tax=Humicola insolens TaxID=85995 RepID=UPI00374272C6
MVKTGCGSGEWWTEMKGLGFDQRFDCSSSSSFPSLFHFLLHYSTTTTDAQTPTEEAFVVAWLSPRMGV